MKISAHTAGYEWTESIYSDGTKRFLSNPQPKLHEQVKVRVRIFKDSPVEAVYVKLFRNGEQPIIPAEKVEEDAAFAWYEAEFEMNQPRMQYEFILAAAGRLLYYTQAGVFDCVQDLKHDFVVMTDYEQPEWVKHAVFYQIFPERFCNGDPSLDVQDGEYKVSGYDTIHIKDWNTPAGTYDMVHCADFYGGDLIGIRKKIPYLKMLGVTALYLNPIFLAPSVHKYDCIDYMHVDPHFGGDQALADLSKALHENDMKLILDISINHTGTAHRWFNKDKLYFDDSVGAYHNPDAKERAYYMLHEDGSYEGWDNSTELPKLNYTSDELRETLYRAEDSVLKKWLKPPYSIDGWRFDVADCCANYNEFQLAREVWPEIRKHIREVNPEAYVLAEHWDDCTDFLQGDAWDATMNYYGFGRVIRQFYGSPDPFYERDPKLWPLTCGLTAQSFRERVEGFLSRMPFALWQNQYNLFDSHDIGRFHIYPGMNARKYKGAVTAMMTMIGTPSVYYGDEAGIGGAVGFFEGGRYPMPWDSGFEESVIFALHRELIHIRREHPVFAEGGFRFLYAEDRVLAFARFDEKECFLTVLSSETEEKEMEIDLRTVGVLQAADLQEMLGEELSYMADGGRIRLKVPAEGTYLIRISLE
ncbi:MAG: alpha amylase N-terminal ig-like domain-containing protein [Lachnospiraceae bacterium]|nr:alpha amylase N-terminal ig-like domain-containing protein [Lachnospiraceae bacterium]